MKRILTCLLFSVMASCAWSQLHITGKIITKEGRPIEYCHITAYNGNNKKITGSVTDSAGTYCLENVDSIHHVYFRCLGYKSKEILLKDLKPVIILELMDTSLKEAIVKGHKQKVKLEQGKLVLNVDGTPLSQQGSIMGVLAKMPGLTASEIDGVDLINGGSLLVLIDNKEIFSEEDLRTLDPRNIVSITLDKAPSARYSGSIDAVLNIKTKKVKDNLSILAKSRIEKSKEFSFDEQFRIGYNTKKSNYVASVNHSTDRQHKDEFIKTYIQPLELQSSLADTTRDHYWNMLLQADFEPTKNFNWGMKYRMTSSRMDALSGNRTLYGTNPSTLDNLLSQSNIDNNTYSHRGNAYIEWAFAQKWKIEVNADAFIKDYHRQQWTDEKGPGIRNYLQMTTNAHYNLWQFSSHLSYKIFTNSTLEGGGKFYKITGTRKQYIAEDKTTDGKNQETMFKAYLNYSFPIKNWYASIGGRYEHAYSRFSDFKVQNNISRQYDNCFANISFSGDIGNTSHTISYSSGTIRPSLSDLSNNSYYSNKFVSSESNPKLQPEKYYSFNYDFIFDILYIGMNYEFSHNTIDNYIFKNPSTANGYVISKVNYDHQHTISLQMNINNTWGWYTLNATGMIKKEFLDGKKYNLSIKRKPLFYTQIIQTLSFKKLFDFELTYTYQSSLTSGIFEAQKQHQLDFEIRKSLWNKKIDIAFMGIDILKTAWDKSLTNIEGIHLQDKTYRDNRTFILQLRFYFNKKKEIKRTDSAKESIQRL